MSRREDEDWGDYFERRITERLGVGHKVIYSNYDTGENDEPIDNMDEVAIEGVGIFTNHEDEFLKNEYWIPFEVTLINPTWLDLAVQAEYAIRFSDHEDHIFFEGVKAVKGLEPGEPARFSFVFGS